MTLNKLVFAFILFLCPLLAACGPAASSVATVSTPTPNANTRVTRVQSPKFVPDEPSPLSTPGAGLYLPEIRVTGPCDFTAPAMLLDTSSSPAVSIPAGMVLVGDYSDSAERITQTTLNAGAGTPVITTILVYRFIAIPGSTTYEANGGVEEINYAIVPTDQVGETIAAIVTSGLPSNCDLTNGTPMVSDSSLVDLGKHYPYPTRFKVCAVICTD